MNKIPVAQTVAEAYRFTFVHLGKVIGLIWLPIVVLTVGAYFVLVPYYDQMAASMENGDIAQQGPMMVRMLAFELVGVVLFAVIAVAVTREILSPLKRPAFLRFGLGPAEFRVVGGFVALLALVMVFTIAVVLVGVVAGVIVNALAPGAGQVAATQRVLGVTGLFSLIGGLAMLFVLVRLSFLLVPAAVIEGKIGLERSWKLTKGNFWRILAIGLATMVPVAAVSLAVNIAILGPDFLNPHFELARDAAAQGRHMAAQMRLMSQHLPLLMGVGFLLAPFNYGLLLSPAAFAYQALTAPQSPQG